MSLYMTETYSQGRPVVALDGELDLVTADHAQQWMRRLFQRGQHRIVLDMSHCGHLDSTGLGVIVSAARDARSHTGKLSLAAPAPVVRRILGRTGLDQVIPVYDTVGEALVG